MAERKSKSGASAADPRELSPEAHARLTELFGEAIELPTTERAAFVDRVRGDDETLAAELVALLAFDDTLASRDAITTKIEAAIGRVEAPVVPGYSMLEILGKGGMGTVFEARQSTPNRLVAIKVLHAISPEALTRFRSEIDIMARLDHPGIAKIYEAGDANGHPYFVMERIEGVTLESQIGKLSRRARLEVFAQICDAVHHAHVKGVFHRDLKPGNVMIREDGRVVVLDFGIARVAAGDGHTQAGDMMGTPVYMSPEQASLRADEVDARSDVYTLGVILYEMLSGSLPYDVRGKAVAAIARVIVDEPARSLSQRDASLRGDLEAICDRALQKEPERRYPSAAALAEDVRKHLEGARVSVRVPGTLEQLRRFVRRRPAIAALIALGIAAAIAVTMLWLDARAAWQTAEREQAELEVRTNQLVIDQAHAALTSDPTRSVALLRTLTSRGVDARVAWSVLDEAIGRGVATEVHREHQGEVRWIEPAPGGYVSGGYDGRALRWVGGKPQVLASEPRRVHVVRPSPDGKQYAIGFDHGGARIVDEAARVVAEVPDLAGDVERLAWSPDGTRLAAADDRGRIVVWSRSEHAVVATATKGIESLVWSPSGATLVAGSDAGEVIRIDLDTNRTVKREIAGEVQALWIDGDELAAIGADGTLHRWHGETVETVTTQLTSKTAAFSGDGTRAMIGGIDGRIAFVDGSTVTMLPAHARQIRSVIASADGKRFATASDDGAVRVWDFAQPRVLALRGHTQRVRQLAFAAGATELLSGDSAGSVRRWELDRIPPTVFEPTSELTRIAIAGDGRSLLTVDIEGEIRRWDLASGSDTRIGTHGRITAATTGATAITASADGVVMWWKPVPVRLNVPGTVRSLAAARDDRFVAAALATGPIVLLSDAPAITLAGHTGGTDAVAVSPDGTLLASGGQDRVVRVWHPASPTEPAVELGPIDGDTRHVVFAQKGALLASAGDDGKVRTWSVRDGVVDPASHKIVTQHQGAVIALTTDGADRLVSVGRDRTRVEVDLARNTSTKSLDADATQPIEGSAWTLRGVPLPLAGGRNLVVATDGRALVIHDTAAHDFTALRARLAAP